MVPDVGGELSTAGIKSRRAMMTTTDRVATAQVVHTRTPAGEIDVAARAHVHAVVRRAGSSFFWAMRILPRGQREAVYAIYAFCREVDDIADDDSHAEDKQIRLAAWREEVTDLYDGTARTLTGLALIDAIGRFDLPQEEFLRLIDAVELDAKAAVHAPAMSELRNYCRGVAGAVGMLLIRIFGAHGPSAEQFAVALGEALQLTNILRDIAEDAERGRLYLPADALNGAGIDPDRTVQEIVSDPRLPAACQAVAKSAQDRFAQANDLLADCDRKALRSALVMKDVYAELLDRLVESGWRKIEHPVHVGGLFKLRAALRYALF